MPNQTSAMFHFINKNSIFQILLLLAGCTWLLIRWISGQPEMVVTHDMPVFTHGTVAYLMQHIVLFKAIIISNLLLQLFLLYVCFSANDFAEERFSLMPLVFYVWLLNGIANPLHISNIFFINTIALFMFNLSIQLNNPSLKGKVFMLGLLTGLGTFLSATMLLFIIYCIISILIYRYSRSKDIVILFLGILLPFVYMLAFGYLTDNPQSLGHAMQQLVIFDFHSTFHGLGITKLLLLIALVILILIIVASQKMQFDNKVILQRRRLTTIAAFTITALFIVIADSSQFPYNLLYLYLPVSIYLAIMSQSRKLRLRHDLLTVLCITLLLLLNLLP